MDGRGEGGRGKRGGGGEIQDESEWATKMSSLFVRRLRDIRSTDFLGRLYYTPYPYVVCDLSTYLPSLGGNPRLVRGGLL